MAIRTYKPTTPSRRQMTCTDYSQLSKVAPEKSLLESLKNKFSLFIFVILLLLICKKINTRGIIMSLYFVLYGFVRCIIETFRGDSLYFIGMKVSQLLSLFLMIAGIILLIIIYTKKGVNNENKYTNKDK